MPKKILFIVYYFPPLSGAGVQRPLKFVKYLPYFGWSPVVLTTTDDSCYEYRDYSLLQEIPNKISIERVADKLDLLAGSLAKLPGLIFILEKLRGKKSENYRRAIRNHLLRIKYLEFPDGQLIWAISAYFLALKIIKKHPVDVIFTTSAPYSNHLIGFWLKRTTGIPWVADFRDEWSKNPIISIPTKIHRVLINKVERQIVNSADHVISVSEPIVESFRRLSDDTHKFSAITNGYDKNDFAFVKEDMGLHLDKKFRMTNVGSFYETPIHFFQAVESLLSCGEIPSEDLQIELVGKFSNPFQFIKPAWKDIIKYTGYLNHRLAIVELLKANVLFFAISNRRGKQMYPGKVFEYLATGIPILAMVPRDSITAELIHKTRAGWVVPPDDIGAIKSTILRLYWDWKKGNLSIDPNKQIIEKFERYNLTRDLANILDKIVDNSGR
jgi:glycosyltransferase involved in cell wall biosynthesis